MKHWEGPEAVRLIAAAADATALFGNIDERARRRLYRVLAVAVHPDRAEFEGITPEQAATATGRLNALYEQVTRHAPQTVNPHVVGSHGTFVLRERLRVDAPGHVATYATDVPNTLVDIARQPHGNDAVHTLEAFVEALAGRTMSAFGPELVDAGTLHGRSWQAYRVPDGMFSLRDVRAAYPDGLDGRDWAWMVRRILMALDTAGKHGNISLDTVLIHPEQHGVMLISPRGASSTGQVSDLFPLMLATNETRQLTFAKHAETLAAEVFLREYDLLLRAMYGPNRFRPFGMPSGPANRSRGAGR